MDALLTLSIAKAANKIRHNYGMPKLSLAFWEENLHPRGQHGRFASKGSSRGEESEEGRSSGGRGNYGEFNGESYNRDEIREEVYRQDQERATKARENLHSFLKHSAIVAGTGLAVYTGHPIIAAILGGYLGFKVGTALIGAVAHAIGKYGTKAVIGTGKVATAPFTAAGRGIYEGVAG